ncbi:MarR family winged helix-turn-helix transcriptional regulator [Nocardia rhizosphaerae]|uniref:MarR family winged helix-turn-helix transcriptional regulator n=1 Tax=Nocardia rhizosphaerae TaxID=1691571 RepID=A0ABV8KZN8_9NOCA
MGDAVDQIIAAWGEVRPDVDVAPMAVVGRITRLSRVLERDLTEFFKGHGMEFWEFDVLATLRRSGGPEGLTAGALNRAAMVTSGAITNRIDRLAAKDLVVRVPDAVDRRSVRVQLTDKGRALVDEVLPLHMANERRLLGELSAGDSAALANLLRALAESLGDTSLT